MAGRQIVPLLACSGQPHVRGGGRALFVLGIFVAASAGMHLLRFGGRRGVLAFASFAAAGAFGLVAVAEQFETWFLDTHILQGLDIWGLAGLGFFGLLGRGLLPGRRWAQPGEQAKA